ncbi:MAG TPA: hypothetical protein DG754_03635 [Bacteroidales bacterium]|jgi:hypothetical protein|nr:hypothetical protein [Bacteroidales bacterium]
MWILSNLNKTQEGNYKNYDNYWLFTSNKETDLLNNGKLIKGNVFQRGNQDSNSIDELFEKYGDKFIHHISGQFVIIKFEDTGFKIYSDHFAIKKFFIWQKGTDFIISDDVKQIGKHVKLRPSKEAMANYAIDYHFTAGTTAFEDLKHNEPGQIIEYKADKLHYSTYWQPEELLKLQKRDVPIASISKALSKAVDYGLKNIDKSKISLSLTGGADTRNLLAVFLNKGIKPHLYTYGNPDSDDCVKAKAIADGLGLNHSIHDIKMTAELFEEYAKKIIKQSDGLASIHRVHRVIAVEQEKQFADSMFLGTLGGEFIKGVSEDDYIVPAVVYENWHNQSFTKEQLLGYLQGRFIKPENVDLDGLLFFVKSQPYLNGSVISRKHCALSYITAHLHDAQDINLYRSVMQNVFIPFLDIDYLELIFSSRYTFDNKEKIENKHLKRLNNPVYASNFIKATYPPLLKFLYSGDHKPSEVLFNKYYAALLKLVRKRRNRGKYKPNFPLGRWMEEFVEKNLPLCYNHKELKDTFDLDSLMVKFKKGNHKPKEAYWLKFTNPIMMRFIIEEFTLR